MRKVHAAQRFVVGLKSFHLDPDLVPDPTGMLRARTLHNLQRFWVRFHSYRYFSGGGAEGGTVHICYTKKVKKSRLRI